VRRSLDCESAATLVHAFVTSRIDYCNALLANALRTTTDKLQLVLNAAARVITGTRKFDRGLTHILHDELHWLDVPQRVTFKLCVTVYKCLHGLAPQYLSELCVPVALQTTPTDDDRHKQSLLVCPYTMCIGGPVIKWTMAPMVTPAPQRGAMMSESNERLLHPRSIDKFRQM